MKNRLFAGSVVGGLIAAAATTAAAAPKVQGLAIGVERTFGFVLTNDTSEGDNNTVTGSSLGFSLGFSPALAGFQGNTATTSWYSAPRVGADYILPSGLTLGGGLGYAYVSASTEDDPDGGDPDETNLPSRSALLLSPRLGFWAPLQDAWAIWPRAGVTYVSITYGEEEDVNAQELVSSRTAFTIEAPLVWMAGQLGLAVTPTIDVGIGGKVEQDGDEAEEEFSATEFGLQFGLFGVI